MNLRNETVAYKAAFTLWLVGLAVFLAGGLLDSWTLVGIGACMVLPGILVLGWMSV